MRLDDSTLPDYLQRLGWLAGGEAAVVEKAGDGNINWVRRVRAGGRSVVVKQARPQLERFPEYEAPTERILCESRYWEIARTIDRERVAPGVVAFDAAAHVLLLEDLGDAERLDVAMARGQDASAPAERLARFLGAVHAATAGDATLARRFPNDGMRRLHGDHIFVLPFHANEFALDPPVRARAEAIWRDVSVREIAATAYARYLEPRGALVHGDVQAGNVLLADRGAVLLDAEIAHVGDPAFDLGTLFAHLWLPRVATGAEAAAEAALDAAWRGYGTARPDASARVRADATRYAAIEMLRRTIGAARVAAVADPAASLRVIDFALALLGARPQGG
jgi:5-methylthioribose kinase